MSTRSDDELLPTPQEQADLRDILRSLRVIRQQGGWGEIWLCTKGGDMVDLRTTYYEKPAIGRKML